MKTSEAVETARQFAKGKGWDHEATLLIGQLALIFQIEALIEALQEGNKQSLAKADIRENHFVEIKKILSSQPIKQPKPIEQPTKGWLRRLVIGR